MAAPPRRCSGVTMADDLKYHDHGDYFTCTVGGVVARCVSCDKPIEYVKKTDGTPGLANHKCSERFDANKRGANRRGEEPHMRTPPYSERLSDGLAMQRLTTKD